MSDPRSVTLIRHDVLLALLPHLATSPLVDSVFTWSSPFDVQIWVVMPQQTRDARYQIYESLAHHDPTGLLNIIMATTVDAVPSDATRWV